MSTITKLTIQIMLSELGYYSNMKLDPIAYHGYRETTENLQNVIEEIDVELLLRPKDTNALLDHRISLQKRLDSLKIEKQINTPAVAV